MCYLPNNEKLIENVDKQKCDKMNMSDRFTLPGRADAVVELWRSRMEEGVLAPAHFQDHWRVTVPRIYSPQPNRTCLGECIFFFWYFVKNEWVKYGKW